MEQSIPFLLQLQAQTQLWHWQTDHYAAHMALGGYYEAMSDLTDRFVEVTKGKNKNGAKPALEHAPIEIKGIVGVDLEAQYSEWAQYLIDWSCDTEISSQPEIQDIVLDMINETHKLVYLLRLK
jgi:hypothetical protein